MSNKALREKQVLLTLIANAAKLPLMKKVSSNSTKELFYALYVYVYTIDWEIFIVKHFLSTIFPDKN